MGMTCQSSFRCEAPRANLPSGAKHRVPIFLPVRSTACQSSFRCEAPRANLPSGAKHRVPIFLPVRSTACQSSFRCEAPRANLPSGAKHRVPIFLPVRSTACQSSFRCEAPRANLPSGAKHRVLCIGHFAQQHLPFGDDADAEFGWIAKPCVIEMGECSHSASEKAAAIVPASLRANFMKPASV